MSDANANIDITELFPELQSVLDEWNTDPTPRTNGNGFENEAGVEPSDIEQALQQRMTAMPQFLPGQSAPPPPAAHVEEGGPPAPATAPVPPAAPAVPTGPGESAQPPAPPAAPPADETLVVGEDEQGQPITISRDAALRYFQFDEDFRNDPELRKLVVDYYVGRGVGGQAPEAPPVPESAPTPQQQQPEPQPQVAAIPEGLDLDDPVTAFLVQQQQALAEQVRMLAGGVQNTQQQVEARTQAENQSLINRAMASFKAEHDLDDQQMENIRVAAARLNVLPSLLQGVDPISGAPSRPDPLTAMDRAFDIAMRMTPEYRQHELLREVQRRVTDTKRKQKLAGLSGSSGSVPRTTPAPTSEQGRRQAMIDEIRQMQEGGWSPPES